MRNFEERKAEVFRRSEKRIKARKQRRNHILMACIPLALCLAILSAFLFPQLDDLKRVSESSNDQHSGALGTEAVCEVYTDSVGVYIDTIVPEAGTDDMAQWHIILEMRNAVEVKGEGSVQVYLDNRLAYEKGTVISPIIGTQSAHIFKEPPAAKLLHGSGSTPLNRAGYSWHYPNEDGTMAAVIADSLHALDCKEILDPICVTGDYVKLAFEEAPDSVEVRCWPDTAWNTNAEPESVNCYDTAFDLKQGGYIYEIIAMWNESEVAHFGSVSYYAYITTEKEHDHQVASEPQTVDGPVVGYCGNTQTTLYIDGEAYTFMYDESVTLTDILLNLDYDPNKLCNCLPEYTVDTEFGKGYGINLTDGYARCNKGQADLTAGQLDQIRSIIEWAKKEKPGK